MPKAAEEMARTRGALPLSNLNYDLLTILQNKLEAIAAYDVYLRDCKEAGQHDCQELVAGLKRDDEKHVERLRAKLEQIAREGKFH
jgi:hypothetical protein